MISQPDRSRVRHSVNTRLSKFCHFRDLVGSGNHLDLERRQFKHFAKKEIANQVPLRIVKTNFKKKVKIFISVAILIWYTILLLFLINIILINKKKFYIQSRHNQSQLRFTMSIHYAQRPNTGHLIHWTQSESSFPESTKANFICNWYL